MHKIQQLILIFIISIALLFTFACSGSEKTTIIDTTNVPKTNGKNVTTEKTKEEINQNDLKEIEYKIMSAFNK